MPLSEFAQQMLNRDCLWTASWEKLTSCFVCPHSTLGVCSADAESGLLLNSFRAKTKLVLCLYSRSVVARQILNVTVSGILATSRFVLAPDWKSIKAWLHPHFLCSLRFLFFPSTTSQPFSNSRLAYAQFPLKLINMAAQVNINDYTNPGIAAAVNPSTYGYHFGLCSAYVELNSADISGPIPNNNDGWVPPGTFLDFISAYANLSPSSCCQTPGEEQSKLHYGVDCRSARFASFSLS